MFLFLKKKKKNVFLKIIGFSKLVNMFVGPNELNKPHRATLTESIMLLPTQYYQNVMKYTHNET